MKGEFWGGRRVFVTGVTGFKGSWLALWLREFGARVVGYSLPPPTRPSLFELAGLADSLEWIEGDVRDLARLRRTLRAAAPEVVFHLAAQPLVRASYELPVETFETNLLGTVHLLDAARDEASVRAVVVITSDKCYENREWCWPYREDDPLGGHDPYSASKACAEVAASAYYRSFLRARGVGVATARAGNIVGGGDWARDRIVPDSIAALSRRESVLVRSPSSERPWQYVLDPLRGYLSIAERLAIEPATFSQPWNFGPDPDAVRSVAEIVGAICETWGGGVGWHAPEAQQHHEAQLLALDASKARRVLGWRPRLGFTQAVQWTVAWYKAHQGGEDMRDFTLRQLRAYEDLSP